MKSKRTKMIALSLCSALLLSSLTLLVGAYSGKLKDYEGLNEKQFDEKLSELNVSEMFDEINELSNEGVEYPNLIDFAFALLERIDSIPENLLIKTIENKRLHPNLRMLCMELLEMKVEDDSGLIRLSDKKAEKLGALVLDKSENSDVRFSLIDLLPRNEKQLTY